MLTGVDPPLDGAVFLLHGDRLRRPPVVRPRLQPGPMEKERLVCRAANRWVEFDKC